jgi:hypothetical protein
MSAIVWCYNGDFSALQGIEKIILPAESHQNTKQRAQRFREMIQFIFMFKNNVLTLRLIYSNEKQVQ